MVLKGSCYCGAVQYEVNDNISTDSAVLCHCTTCSKLHSNSSFNVKTELNKIKFTKTEPKIFNDDKANSGKRVRRFFCGECSSAILSAPDAMPGVAFIKLGGLENSLAFTPAAEIYVEQAYDHAIVGKNRPGVKSFEGMMAKEVKL